ncbi:DUF7503 family protein [Haladaptatus sp. DFWS20]
MTDHAFQSYLTENPQTIGMLFMAVCLLSQAGSAAAGVGTVAVYGP